MHSHQPLLREIIMIKKNASIYNATRTGASYYKSKDSIKDKIKG